jgi:tRNA(Arg) A34 adenosine deaminase TadA
MPSLNQLTLWTTQHPCSMCAAAIAFVGIGEGWLIADDP